MTEKKILILILNIAIILALIYFFSDSEKREKLKSQLFGYIAVIITVGGIGLLIYLVAYLFSK